MYMYMMFLWFLSSMTDNTLTEPQPLSACLDKIKGRVMLSYYEAPPSHREWLNINDNVCNLQVAMSKLMHPNQRLQLLH